VTQDTNVPYHLSKKTKVRRYNIHIYLHRLKIILLVFEIKRMAICIVYENTEWNFGQGLLLSNFLLPEMEVLLSSDQ